MNKLEERPVLLMFLDACVFPEINMDRRCLNLMNGYHPAKLHLFSRLTAQSRNPANEHPVDDEDLETTLSFIDTIEAVSYTHLTLPTICSV